MMDAVCLVTGMVFVASIVSFCAGRPEIGALLLLLGVLLDSLLVARMMWETYVSENCNDDDRGDTPGDRPGPTRDNLEKF